MRHKGGVRKQRGRWLGLWYENGIKKSKVLGLVKDMAKTEARDAVAAIIAGLRDQCDPTLFGVFVEGPFFKFYERKWKASTGENNKQRIRTHLIGAFDDRTLGSLTRDELQDFLDKKGTTLSFSVVDHLRWDLKQVCDMAVSEGLLTRNPALLLFTPKTATKPIRRVMTIAQVRTLLGCLGVRERLIAKLAILGGMRPGEIFALTWGRVTDTFADVNQRVYRGLVDTPKTTTSVRHAALTEGLLADLAVWRSFATNSEPEAWVFPSERMYELKNPKKPTPVRKDNVWQRNIQPLLEKVGLGWCNFQVMRRTHATLMRELKADPKLVADQLGHTVDVSLNVYAQSPVEGRAVLVNELERLLVQ